METPMKRIKTKLTNNRNIILFIIVHFVLALFLTYESQHFQIDFIHYFIQNILLTIPVLIMTNKKYRKDKKLIIKLNILYFILFFGFFHYKMSILTVLKNKLLKLDKCTPFNGSINGNNPNCYQNAYLWMDTHKITLVLVVIMNIISLFKQ